MLITSSALLLAAAALHGAPPPGGAPAAPSAEQEPTPRAAPGAEIERHLGAMGTSLSLHVQADDRSAALRASELALRAIESTESRLSTWRADSELAQLNAAAVGRERALSPTLARELTRALELGRETSGAFDPCVGALVGAYDLRGSGRWPSAEELQHALATCEPPALRVRAAGATRLRRGLVLEEGGFGKGAGLDAAVALLAGSGARRAVLDLGGQIAIWDEARAQAPRERVELAHPTRRTQGVLALDVPPGSLATTGNSERGLSVDGRSLGHVLDPRTGHPSPDFGSLTVWCPSALDADALSTGLYVLGPDAALAYAALREDVEVIALLVDDSQQLEIRASDGWRTHTHPMVDVPVRFHD